jgi:serine/threonine-protein kinase
MDLPRKLGRYEIVRELGRGAMGVVYEAIDPNIGRKVALKTIGAGTLGTNAEEVAKRFKNEARAAGGLNHPNIVTIYDADEQNGILYLAMEFLQGATLDVLLHAQQTLKPDQTVDIVRQVCAGLEYAHSKGVVHRDIKPGNIMVSATGAVKITDFGIARTANVMTMTGQVLGTPNYMSPEQVVGKTVDGRSDLFSVGVVLYEMVTGERPFDGQSITTIMYKIVHETPVAPNKLDQTIHPGLSRIIEKCLAKPPEKRYQSAAEISSALQNYTMATADLHSVLEQPTVDMTASGTGVPSVPATIPEPQSPKQTETPAQSVSPPKASRNAFRRIAAVIVILGVACWVLWQLMGRGAGKATAPNAKPASQATSTSSGQADDETDTSPETSGSEHPVIGGLVTHQPAKSDRSTATLRLNSDPPTAAIFLDGKDTGKKTPSELQVSKGQHSVSVKMEGFQPSSVQFRVKGGEELEFLPKLSVAIPNMQLPSVPNVPGMQVPGIPDVSKMVQESQQQAKYWQQWSKQYNQQGGTIMVRCLPKESHILVNGSDTGKTGSAMIPEAPGTYTIRCEMPGYVPQEKEVEVQGKKPGTAKLVLKPVGENSATRVY